MLYFLTVTLKMKRKQVELISVILKKLSVNTFIGKSDMPQTGPFPQAIDVKILLVRYFTFSLWVMSRVTSSHTGYGQCGSRSH
jgi:hypothetical protein